MTCSKFWTKIPGYWKLCVLACSRAKLLELPQVLAAFVRTTDKRFEAIEKRLDGHDKHLRRIDNSLGVLKGGHARSAALRDTALIADSMGFDLVRTMSQREIISLARSQNAREIPKNELQSFCQG